MVKYGKLFRELQIKEFKGNYINYKKLKQKIKQIQEILPRTSQQLIRKFTKVKIMLLFTVIKIQIKEIIILILIIMEILLI